MLFCAEIEYIDNEGKYRETYMEAPHLSNVLDVCKFKQRTIVRICRVPQDIRRTYHRVGHII